MDSRTYAADGVTLLEHIEDHGDGTGTRTRFDPDTGAVISTETVSIDPEPTPPAIEVLAAALVGQPPGVLARLPEVIAIGAALVDASPQLTQAVADEDPLAGVAVVAQAVTEAAAPTDG